MFLSLILRNNFVNCTPTESNKALIDYVNDKNKKSSLKVTPINSGKQIEISLANNNEGCRFFPKSIKIITFNDVNKLNDSKLSHSKTLSLTESGFETSVDNLGLNYKKLDKLIEICDKNSIMAYFFNIVELYTDDYMLNQDKEIVRSSLETYNNDQANYEFAEAELYTKCRQSSEISAVLKITDFNEDYSSLNNNEQQEETFINRIYAFFHFYPVIKINSEALISELTPLGQEKVASGTVFQIELCVGIYDASKIFKSDCKLLKNPEKRCTKLLQVSSVGNNMVIKEFAPTLVKNQKEKKLNFWIRCGIFIGVSLIIIILLAITYKIIKNRQESNHPKP